MSRESPIVEEVRARADAISTRYRHDLEKYAEHLREIERQNASRLVEQPKVTKAGERPDERSKPAA